VQMRAELKRFHQELHATVLYVTHDQLEAVTMADRIAVMHLGVLQQYATPDEIYNRPLNTFVAGFIGSPAMNLLRGQVTTLDGQTAIAGDGGWQLKLEPGPARRALASGGQVIVGVRHGHIRLSLEPEPDWMEGRVYTIEPTGDLTYAHIQLGGHLLVASSHAGFRAAPDAPIWITFDQDHMHLFDVETEQLLEDAGMPLRLSQRREPAAV
jgi:multiple sugar transport system ATP-binding protein